MRWILLLALVSFGGCASLFNAWMGIDFDLPGRGVNDRVAQQWNCRADRVQIAAEEYRKELSVGQTFVPQVGWNACELLARMGAPRDYNLQQTTSGRSASLWYGRGTDPHLVSLDLNPTRNEWVVTYVGY